MNIAIVGATGNVGRKLMEVLEKKNFPITEAYLVASSNSEARRLVEQGAVRINDKKVGLKDNVIFESGDILRVGKRKFAKLIIK